MTVTAYIRHDNELRRVEIDEETIEEAKQIQEELSRMSSHGWKDARIMREVEMSESVDDDSIHSDPLLRVTPDSMILVAYGPEGVDKHFRFYNGSIAEGDSPLFDDLMLFNILSDRDIAIKMADLEDILVDDHEAHFDDVRESYIEERVER